MNERTDMYRYNLIIKAGRIEDMDALVNRKLTDKFGPDVHYHFRDKLTEEAIVIVASESKRCLQSVLGDWFAEDSRTVGSFRPGTLLHYREILPNESLTA